MWKKVGVACLGLLVTLLVICGGTLKASAKDITSETTGLSLKDVTIEKLVGGGSEPVDYNSDLEASQNYSISYEWGINDGVIVHDGDTANVELPTTANTSNVGDLDIMDSHNDTLKIGTFKFNEGTNTGTITFNDNLSHTNSDRMGLLGFTVTGTKVASGSGGSGSGGPGYVVNKNGWVYGEEKNSNKIPKVLQWDVLFNVGASHMGKTIVTDTLGDYQTYRQGSTMITYKDADGKEIVYTDTDGNKVSAPGDPIDPIISPDGKTLTYIFPDVSTSIEVEYLADVDSSLTGTSGVLTNGVSVASANGITGDPGGNGAGTIASPATSHNDIYWGGYGNIEGKYKGTIVLTKTDVTTKQALSGAEYTLYDSSDQAVSSGTTDGQGVITMSHLKPGDYYFLETKAPSGYALNPDKVPVTVTDSDGDTPVATWPVDEKNRVTFTKTDAENDAVLSGAVYDLYNGTGIVKSGLKTDVNGQIHVTGLVDGDYYFKETAAPIGYDKNENTVPFTVTSTMTKDIQVGQKDSKIKLGSATLTKLGSDTGYGVGNAWYELLAADQQTVVSGPQQTDARGLLTVNNLTYGTYYFKETQAPDGYEPNLSLAPVTIDATNKGVGSTTQTDMAVPTGSSSSSSIMTSSSSELSSSSSSIMTSSSSELSSSSSSITTSSSSEPSSSSSSITTSSSSEPSSSSSSITTSSSSESLSSSSSITTSSSTPSIPSVSSSNSSNSSMTSSSSSQRSSSSSVRTTTSSTSTGSSSADVVTGGVPVTGLGQSSSSDMMGGGTGAFADDDSASSSSTTAKNKSNRYLPQTNEEKSAGVLLAGLLLLGFGTSLWRLRQRRE
ncbi:SpaA isopeptide-forming pilin-related protein [Levilactobacillus fujinensis]|uniref:SpaA isopeptide-forming pilin-related protein n=1 Tax=Levilactobacillus fujinensis TaxID=2486024 RepID=A0ABW1TGR9_9LACO|nr:SpaA isopeptide-forming pilin-related protein [Levilactobacillus fujinensis]